MPADMVAARWRLATVVPVHRDGPLNIEDVEAMVQGDAEIQQQAAHAFLQKLEAAERDAGYT